MRGSLCLPSKSTRMGWVKPSRSHPPTPQLKRSFKYDICISDRSKLPVERATKSLARNSWVLRVQNGCCGYTDEYDVLRCLILSGEVSFPEFTRHFFPSLTETIDSFAKCILNQWTQASNLWKVGWKYQFCALYHSLYSTFTSIEIPFSEKIYLHCQRRYTYFAREVYPLWKVSRTNFSEGCFFHEMSCDSAL